MSDFFSAFSKNVRKELQKNKDMQAHLDTLKASPSAQAVKSTASVVKQSLSALSQPVVDTLGDLSKRAGASPLAQSMSDSVHMVKKNWIDNPHTRAFFPPSAYHRVMSSESASIAANAYVFLS